MSGGKDEGDKLMVTVKITGKDKQRNTIITHPSHK